ncbi:MAG: hypothetical protein GY849_20295 [Deltaproteobacteria bacterium]|nr:hypothetical protein [Deltaproteobacteria bacterium]
MKRHEIVFTILSFFIMSGFLSFQSPVSAETANKVVAIVNDDVITLHELNEQIGRMTGSEPRHLKIQDENRFLETQRKILDAMIAEKIAKEKLKQLGINVTPVEVDRAIEEIRTNNRMTHEQMVAGLKSQGLSYEMFRKRIKAQLEQSRIINIEVQSRIIIREEQVKAYYEQHKEEFRTGESVRLAAIVLKQKGAKKPDRSGPLYRKAHELLSRIRQGEDFGELAREFSQGPGAKEGGELGAFKTSQLDPDLVNAINRMSPGDVSELIIRPSAIQIVKLVEKNEETQKPFDQVSDAIQALLYRKEVQKRYSSWIKELKEKAYTKIFL